MVTDFSSQAGKARYYRLSSQLAQVDKTQLESLLSGSGPTRGWGGTQVIPVGGSKVFVKRVPMTDVEHENLFSTKNLFDLPFFYNYGVGSAGFGVFRELVTHIKTTNWVLEGTAENFPLLYHYRIVPSTGAHPEIDSERHNGYIRYWNSDENIDRYMTSRSRAPYEIILFLEYIPHMLQSWLAKNMDKLETVIGEMLQTIAFLREKGVIHFDAHFGNILVDTSGKPYLTDFGLVLDKSFALSQPEKAFFNRHIDYDYAEFLENLGTYIYALFRYAPVSRREKVMRRYGIEDETNFGQVVPLLLDKMEEIQAHGLMKLDARYVESVVRYRELILCMRRFYSDLRANDKKIRHTHTAKCGGCSRRRSCCDSGLKNGRNLWYSEREAER